MKYPTPMPRPMMGGGGVPIQPAPQGNRFMNFARNNSDMLMQTGLGLLSGRTGPEQFAMGAQGLVGARQSAKEAQKKNQTIEYLKRSNPELGAAAEAGLIDPATAFKLDYQQRQQSQQGAEPTAAMREYEFAKGQGFGGSFMDFQTAKGRAGATTVNVGTQSEVGSIPQGFELITNPETGARSMQRIPGGPEDTSKNEAAKASQEAQKASVALRSIGNIRQKLGSKGMFDLPEVGVIGGRLAEMGINQEAVDVKNELASLQSIVSFDRLQAMREASPTGGALGAVSERELLLLQSSLGALNNMSSEEQLLQTLDFIEGVMKKFAAYPGGEAAIGGSGPIPASPTGAVDINSLIDQYAD